MSLTIHFLSINGVIPVGTYFRIHNFARALTGVGQQVRIFAMDHDPQSRSREEERDGIRYVITPSMRGQRFFTHRNHPVQALIGAASDYGDCDVLHMFQPFLGTYVPWCRKLGKQSVSCWYDWDDLWTQTNSGRNVARMSLAEKWSGYWTNHIEHRAPRRAAGVTAISHWLAREAERRGASRTAVIYPSVWPEPRKLTKSEARGMLGLDQSCIYVGFMGQNVSLSEFDWCVEGLRHTTGTRVRLGLCGMAESLLARIPPELKARVDYLGVLAPSDARLFARSIDVGLLPLENNLANLTRFPQKFVDYLVGGAYTLVSDVGEASRLARMLPSVIDAGRGSRDWVSALKACVADFEAGKLEPVDLPAVEAAFSWKSTAEKLLNGYLTQ